MSLVLATGVTVSAVLIGCGFVAALAVGWQSSLIGSGGPVRAVTDFGSLWAGLVELRPVAVTQLGLLVLIATPVVRVATTLLVFLVERDRLYVACTAIVLAILLTSLFLVR